MPQEFTRFDRRGYRTVDARTGYAAWAATYEDTVESGLDLALLGRAPVDWASVREAADLGAGTGRTGGFLRERGVAAVDGVDLTAEMLARVPEGVFRRLELGDVAATPFAGAAYDLVTCCLVDEHLADLRPLYAEAERLLRPGGAFVLVGIHPAFVMASGMPTHYDDAAGEPVAIAQHVHLLGEHVAAGLGAGLVLAALDEEVIDAGWLARKPRWEPFVGWPASFALTWRRPVRETSQR